VNVHDEEESKGAADRRSIVGNIASFLEVSAPERGARHEVRGAEALGSWREAWLALVEQTPGCSIELHPELVFHQAGGRAPALIYLDHEGKTLGTVAVLVPKELRLFSHPSVSWLGRLQGYRLAGNQLLGCADRAAADRFLDAVRVYLGQDGADCLYIEDLDHDTPLWQALHERMDAAGLSIEQPRPSQPHWRIRFPGPAGDYWKSVSAKSRYKTRRAARDLPHEVRRYSAPTDVQTFLACAEDISQRSWQGRRIGLRLALNERFRAHFDLLARLGALRSYVLHHDDRPAAFVYGWQWNGRFEYEEIGYASELADNAPGRVLLYRVLEDLVADDTPEVLDFGCGDAEYKRVFGTHESASGPLVVASDTVKTQIWSGLRHTRAAVDRGMRGFLRHTGLYEKARRLYRHAAR
jgi:CelD/BcsL family acetyltransferase involved in cellulose biosynthesis